MIRDPIRMGWRGRRPVVQGFRCSAVVLFLVAESALAGDVPDSVKLLEIRMQLERTKRVRVVAGGKQFMASGPSATTEGVTFTTRTVRERFTYQDVSEPRGMPWADIQSIEAQGDRTRQSVLVGAVTGATIGLLIGSQQPCERVGLFGQSGNCGGRRFMPVFFGLLGGAVIAGVIGNQTEEWRRLYP